jgi:hypothetical protein
MRADSNSGLTSAPAVAADRADEALQIPPVGSGGPLFGPAWLTPYNSMHGMAKFSQIEANAFLASASSKQKRVPLSPCSTHQSTFCPR